MPLTSGKDNNDVDAGKDKNAKAPVKMVENAVPLAAAPGEDGSLLDFWWVLLVVLFGATGTAMYENHKKKAAAKNNTPSKND